MSGNPIEQPFPIFTDVDGSPLEDGFIFIGVTGLNPETSPVQVFSDSELTTPVAQPVRTLAGYPSASGTPIKMFIAQQNYSIIVRDKNQSLVSSTLFALGSTSGSVVDIINFGVAGDGVTDDTVGTQSFFNFLATNGGKGIISVPVRVSTITLINNMTPFVVEWLGQNTVMSANTIATPLNFQDCSSITFIRPTINGRASEQGAILVADGVYHAMLWDDCTDMYAYQANVRNYNGIGINALKSSGTGLLRNYIVEGQADCESIGEDRTGFQIESGADSHIVNCYATGMQNVRDVIPFPRTPNNATF